jgi:hypothetical protein
MLVSVSVFEVCMIDSVPASSLGLEWHVYIMRRAVKLVGYILTSFVRNDTIFYKAPGYANSYDIVLALSLVNIYYNSNLTAS